MHQNQQWVLHRSLLSYPLARLLFPAIVSQRNLWKHDVPLVWKYQNLKLSHYWLGHWEWIFLLRWERRPTAIVTKKTNELNHWLVHHLWFSVWHQCDWWYFLQELHWHHLKDVSQQMWRPCHHPGHGRQTKVTIKLLKVGLHSLSNLEQWVPVWLS